MTGPRGYIMSNKFFSVSTSKYKTFCITLLLFLQLIWTIPAQAIVEFNDMRDMWLNERYSEVLPLLLEADSKYGVELEYMIGTSACRIKGQQTQELGLALLKRILSEQRLSKTEHESIKAEIVQCNNIIAFLYGAENTTLRESSIAQTYGNSIQPKEVVFYRQEVVSDIQMAQLQANDTENSFAGVGLITNAPSNVQQQPEQTQPGVFTIESVSPPKQNKSSQNVPLGDPLQNSSINSLQIQFAIKGQIQRLMATKGQVLSNIQIKGNIPLKKCPGCVKPKTWKKPDSLKNKLNIYNKIVSGNKIGTRPIISKRIATGSNLVTPKITSLPKVTGSKVKMPKPTTPRATAAPKNIVPKFMAPKRTIPTAAVPRRATSKFVTPRRTAPTAVAPKRTTSRVATPRRTAPAAAAPRRTTSRVAIPRRTTPTAAAPRKTTSRVAPPRRTAPTAAAPRRTTSRVVTPRRTAPTAAVPRKTTSRVATPRRTAPTAAALRKTRPGIAQ